MQHSMKPQSDPSIPYLKPGGYIMRDDAIYRISSVDLATGEVELLIKVADGDTSEPLRVKILEFLASSDEHIVAESLQELDKKLGRLASHREAPPTAGLPPKFLEKARRIKEVVEGFREHLRAAAEEKGECVRITDELDVYLKQYDITRQTYYNYRNEYNAADGDERKIAANRRRCTFNKKKMSSVDQCFFDYLILGNPNLDVSDLRDKARDLLKHTDNLWVDPQKCEESVPQDLVEKLRNTKISIKDILNSEQGPLLSIVKLPEKTSFYEYYNAFVASSEFGREVIDSRYGEGTWESELMVFDTFVHLASQPLQYVFLDHYLLDVFSVDEETRSDAERLWLTVLIDAYTRSVLGFVLLHGKKPNIMSVQTAYGHGLWAKKEPQIYGIQGKWETYGPPVLLFMDNAWEHHSKSVENLLTDPDFGTTPVFRPPYKGRYGALIERFFGGLSRRLKTRLKNAGGIPSSDQKEVRNAAKSACLLYDDIYRFILEEIVHYQNSPHSELGMSPNEKWEEARSYGIVPPPDRTKAIERKLWREYNGMRPIHKNGIHLFGMRFNSVKLQSLPKKYITPQINSKGKLSQTIEYTIKYNPLDLSSIAIFRGTEYLCDAHPIELKMPNNQYKKVSEAERELAQQIARRAGRKNPARDWVDYIDELKEEVKTRQSEKRKAQRQAMNGHKQAQTKYEPDELEAAINQHDQSRLFSNADDGLAALYG